MSTVPVPDPNAPVHDPNGTVVIPAAPAPDASPAPPAAGQGEDHTHPSLGAMIQSVAGALGDHRHPELVDEITRQIDEAHPHDLLLGQSLVGKAGPVVGEVIRLASANKAKLAFLAPAVTTLAAVAQGWANTGVWNAAETRTAVTGLLASLVASAATWLTPAGRGHVAPDQPDQP